MDRVALNARPVDWVVGFGAALAFAFYIVFSKRGLAKYPPETVLFHTLLIAGAHRRAAGGRADVAHNEHSLYQALSVAFVRSGVPQVQVHGFADLNLPDHDIAVSTGTSAANPLATRVAEGLAEAGFDECRAWAQRCGRLEGTTNVQAKAAAAEGAAFVHVELSNSVRMDREQRAALVDALATAV